MIRFYAPDIESLHCLPEADSAHCHRVLRLKAGDTIEAVDGEGHLFECRITVSDSRKVEIEILSRKELPPYWPGELTLAVAPTKNADRMEWLMEKAVECGLDRFVPLRCGRSERKDLNHGRMEKIAVSAMKQSLKATLPAIENTTGFAEYVKNCRASQKFICYCDENIERKLITDVFKKNLPTAFLIGPEGDFSPSEVNLAIGHGFMPVSLGDARLRTETAALCACQTFHILNQLKS